MTLAERIARDEPIVRQELKSWKGWSDRTISRYEDKGLPYSNRGGMRKTYTPSKVDAWHRGDPPVRGRGRPRRVS
jgi:hypothetical protein